MYFTVNREKDVQKKVMISNYVYLSACQYTMLTFQFNINDKMYRQYW